VLIAFGLAALVVWLTGSHDVFWHWIEVHTGTVNESGPYYGFWSGFGSDLGEVTLIAAILTPAVMAARHSNCHTRGCWRITMHKVKDPQTGVEYRQCHKHHPDLTGHHHERFWQHHFSDDHLADVHARIAADRSSG
jgi:hypothetical protein